MPGRRRTVNVCRTPLGKDAVITSELAKAVSKSPMSLEVSGFDRGEGSAIAARLRRKINPGTYCELRPTSARERGGISDERWLFALFLVLFLGFGALLYVTFWVLTSKSHVFLRVLDGDIQVSGDAWLVELQEREREHVIERARQIKEHGFWVVMWPSLIGGVSVLVVWFLIIWLFVQVVR